MQLKDYYNILELPPSATTADIKKAYRRLALLHHPDKNNNDPLAAARFAEIKEAYEVMTDPAKKEYYLQQRWYKQSTGSRKTRELISPANVLKEALELERYVSKLDVFRMDKAGLQEYILDLLSNDTIEKLHAFRDSETCRQIQGILISAMKPLPDAYTGSIVTQLQRLCANDPQAEAALNQFVQQHRKKHLREKHTLTAIIIITLLLCLLIYFAGR